MPFLSVISSLTREGLVSVPVSACGHLGASSYRMPAGCTPCCTHLSRDTYECKQDGWLSPHARQGPSGSGCIPRRTGWLLHIGCQPLRPRSAASTARNLGRWGQSGPLDQRRLSEADMTPVDVGDRVSDDVLEVEPALGTFESTRAAALNDGVLAAPVDLYSG